MNHPTIISQEEFKNQDKIGVLQCEHELSCRLLKEMVGGEKCLLRKQIKASDY